MTPVVDLERRLRQVEQDNAAIRQQAESQEERLRQVMGLIELYARLDERLAGFQSDVHEAHEAIRELSTRMDREREERRAGQMERREELVKAKEERDLEIARMKADAERQYTEIQARNVQQRTETRRMVFGLAGIFLTSAAAVVSQILGAGSP
jgi:peptidoglycan hydrolase CwlO-like protein